MRKLGSKPSENWTREATEVTADTSEFTGHWAKGGSGEVWVQAGGSYLEGGGEGIMLAQNIHSESDAYNVFGAAGYVRYDNLGPIPGNPLTWSCRLSIGNKFASVERTASTIAWQRGTDWTAVLNGEAPGFIFTVAEPMPGQFELMVGEDDGITGAYSSSASSLQAAQEDAEEAYTHYLQTGSWD